MDNSLLSSVHVRFGDQAFNLFADDNGEPVILENAIHSVSWPYICTVFSTGYIQASNLPFMPSKVSIEDNAAYIMVTKSPHKISCLSVQMV